jgi:hypothetical protein
VKLSCKVCRFMDATFFSFGNWKESRQGLLLLITNV